MAVLKTRNYSDWLNSTVDLIGVDRDSIPTTVSTPLNGSFNSAMAQAWVRSPWLDVCPYGEARFVANQLTAPNDFTNAAWTATNLTVTADSLANPADGRVTASKVLETVTNGAHKVAQSMTFFPTTQYQVSFYARANSRNWAYLSISDGATTYTAFFNVVSGTVGTATNFSSTSIAQQSNGFFLCTAQFTSASTAGSGSVAIQTSTDGSTTSFAGTTTAGLYLWGALAIQQTYAAPTNNIVSWDQSGEEAIDAVFEVWADSPVAAQYPRKVGWELSPTGIQIIADAGGSFGLNLSTLTQVPQANPVYLYYRKRMPSFMGGVFDSTDTYAVDDQVYFTTSAGAGNYYKCLVATSAGESPDTTPASWELLEIPAIFYEFTKYQAFAEFLVADGQIEKAGWAFGQAEDRLNNEFDRIERQMGWVQPTTFSTHVTSQARN